MAARYLDCVPNISDADFERFAQQAAADCGHDLAAISFQLSRFLFGSLSTSWEAAPMRRLYCRAMEIAQAHRDAAHAA
jgi:hypothetical protein